jgi:ABC-type bacteriocin/lantibiotic exporter with double-glycine peptidase domain
MGEIEEIYKTFVRGSYENSVVYYVASLLQYFNIGVTQEYIKEKLQLDEKESTTLADIATALESFGLITEAFEAESVSDMDELTNPAIIPVESDEGTLDFGIYYGKQENRYLIGLPSWGLHLYTGWEFEAIWDSLFLLEVKNNDKWLMINR